MTKDRIDEICESLCDRLNLCIEQWGQDLTQAEIDQINLYIEGDAVLMVAGDILSAVDDFRLDLRGEADELDGD